MASGSLELTEPPGGSTSSGGGGGGGLIPPPYLCRAFRDDGTDEALLAGGGPRNIAAALVGTGLAEAHLKTWDATAPLWRTHLPGECTHWCSPSAYHLWLYLLNDVLRDSGLGNAVAVPDRPLAAAEAAAAAADAAATTATWAPDGRVWNGG